MTDSIEFLRKWGADIRKSSGVSVDADKLDAIAEEIGDLRARLRVDPDFATAAYMAGSRYWRKRAEKAEAALKAATEWRPMETAPECFSVLLRVGGAFVPVVSICDGGKWYPTSAWPGNPTGWLPLPDVGGKAELAALKGGAE